MRKPIAVLCSDIHYSLQNLKLADAAMRQAITKANELNVPLIVAGDLHDTKANMRGECVNAMIQTFKSVKTKAFVLVGNHDKINEKSQEHSLNFLVSENITIISTHSLHWNELNITMIGYQWDKDVLKTLLTQPSNDIIIMHQGIVGSDSGEYIQDHSAITKVDVAGRRIISGHYHKRQTINLPDDGKWDYIGSPYTMNFGEANDPPKGFQILMEDGSLEFVPTNLRKHVIYEWNCYDNIQELKLTHNTEDLVWLKLTGTVEQLNLIDRSQFQGIRLDLIPIEIKVDTTIETTKLTNYEILDNLIDTLSDTSNEQKNRLKTLWKDLKP